MLTLYVVPPAFGLPSIDPECLATISFLKATFPQEAWTVIPDVNAVGNGASGDWSHLPALWEGDRLYHGYFSIFQRLVYLSGKAAGRNASSEDNFGDDFRYINNIQHRLSPLLSLLLYTSPENYTATVRPAYGKVLPFPSSWVLPVNQRTLQMGLALQAGIDVTPKQLTALASSLIDKPKKTDAESLLAKGDPLSDEDILRLHPVEKIPRDNSTSAVIETHRTLRELLDDALLVYKSEGSDENPSGYQGSNARSHLLFANLGIAIAAARQGLPHPWLSTQLENGYPELTTQTLNWLTAEFGWTNEQPSSSRIDHVLDRNVPSAGIGERMRSFVTGTVQLAGSDRLQLPSCLFTRSVKGFDGQATGFYQMGPSRGKPLGHEVDSLWLGATGVAVTLLGLKAWQDGF